MKGLNLTTAMLQKSDNPEWRKLSGGSPDRKPRKKRFTGDTSEKKRWVREQSAKPGRFFETGRQLNWLNVRKHWASAASVKGWQKEVACAETWALLAGKKPTFPVHVTLTRYGPRLMDRDGSIAALKYYQDGVAAAMGVDDGDRSRIDWSYEQEQTAKVGWYGVRVSVAGGAA